MSSTLELFSLFKNDCSSYFMACRLPVTFLVSSFWHGIYAGHYMCLSSVPFYLPIEDIYVKHLRDPNRNPTVSSLLRAFIILLIKVGYLYIFIIHTARFVKIILLWHIFKHLFVSVFVILLWCFDVLYVETFRAAQSLSVALKSNEFSTEYLFFIDFNFNLKFLSLKITYKLILCQHMT